jgi:hypothetical protein
MPILTGSVDFAYNVSEIFLTEDSDDSLNTLVLMKNAGAAVCRVICVFAMPNVNANHQRVLFLLLEAMVILYRGIVACANNAFGLAVSLTTDRRFTCPKFASTT